MKKNEKRTYLSPETEVVRFNADIITTSGGNIQETDPDDSGYNVENNALLNEPY